MTLLDTNWSRYFGEHDVCGVDVTVDTAAFTRPQARFYLSDYSTATIVVGLGEPSYGNWTLSVGATFPIPRRLWDYIARRQMPAGSPEEGNTR